MTAMTPMGRTRHDMDPGTDTDAGLDPLRLRVARLLQALGEPARLRIVAVLAAGEAPVAKVAAAARLTPAAASRQLTLMFNAGVLARRRDGTQVRYRLVDTRVTQLCRLAAALLPAAPVAGATELARVFNRPTRRPRAGDRPASGAVAVAGRRRPSA